jgi:hypothetical protein
MDELQPWLQPNRRCGSQQSCRCDERAWHFDDVRVSAHHRVFGCCRHPPPRAWVLSAPTTACLGVVGTHHSPHHRPPFPFLQINIHPLSHRNTATVLGCTVLVLFNDGLQIWPQPYRRCGSHQPCGGDESEPHVDDVGVGYLILPFAWVWSEPPHSPLHCPPVPLPLKPDWVFSRELTATTRCRLVAMHVVLCGLQPFPQ